MASWTSATSSRQQQGDRDDRLDRLFGALSHRVRRAMLARLAAGPATAGQLAEPHDISLPAVTKHLKTMEGAGLIRRTVDGRVHHCTLRAEGFQNVEAWLAHYRVFWDDTLDALAAYVEDDA